MDKLSRTAKTLDKFVAFAYGAMVFVIAMMVLLVAVLGFLAANDAQLLKENQSYSLALGDLQLYLAPGVMSEITIGNYGSYLLWSAVLALVSGPVYCVMLLTIRDILKPFIQREPFHQTVAKDLKKLAVLVAADMVINDVSVAVLSRMTAKLYDLQKLFGGERILSASLSTQGTDLTPLFFAAALYLLSKVFQYGEQLQQLSDETL